MSRTTTPAVHRHICDRCGSERASEDPARPTDWAYLILYPASCRRTLHLDLCPACASSLDQFIEQVK